MAPSISDAIKAATGTRGADTPIFEEYGLEGNLSQIITGNQARVWG